MPRGGAWESYGNFHLRYVSWIGLILCRGFRTSPALNALRGKAALVFAAISEAW